jgi:hypothetical protein
MTNDGAIEIVLEGILVTLNGASVVGNDGVSDGMSVGTVEGEIVGSTDGTAV